MGPHESGLVAGHQLHLALQFIGENRPGPPDLIQTHRQEQLTRRGLRIEGGCHDLEATIQQGPVTGASGAFQAGPGLIALPPHRLQGLKGRPVAEAKASQRAVKGGQWQGCSAIRAFRASHGRLGRGCRHQGLAMAAPGPLCRHLAVELDPLGAQHQLEFGGRRSKAQGLVQLQIGQGQKAILQMQRRHRQGDEACGREHHLAADAVVDEIRGLRCRQEGAQAALCPAGERQGLQHGGINRCWWGRPIGPLRSRGSALDVIEPHPGPGLAAPAPPVALALEWVSGQLHPPVGEGPVEAAPVQRKALAVQRRQAGKHHLPVGLARPQAGPPLQLRIRQTLPTHADQGGTGPQFQEGGDALGGRRRHALGKAHRTDHVIAPVIGLGNLRAGDLTGEIAHQGTGGR